MATHPVVEATASTNYSADQTSHVINLPSGITAGDLLLVWFCWDGNAASVTTPSGWTAGTSTLTQTDRSILFYKTASGSEGSTVTITTSASESSSAVAFRISAWTSITISESTNASSSLFNPPNVTAPSSSYCYVFGFVGLNGNRSISTDANGTSSISGTADGSVNTTYARAIYARHGSLISTNVPVMTGVLDSAATYRAASVLVAGAAIGGVKTTRAMNAGYNA